MPTVLLDTGPLVALIDRRDPAHGVCSQAFSAIKSKLVTTEAVLTEAMHLIDEISGQLKVLKFIASSGTQIIPTDILSLAAIGRLMEKYQDVPMDYADGTLVRLAEELDTNVIFTIDRRGFQAYRIHGRRPFVLIPTAQGGR